MLTISWSFGKGWFWKILFSCTVPFWGLWGKMRSVHKYLDSKTTSGFFPALKKCWHPPNKCWLFTEGKSPRLWEKCCLFTQAEVILMCMATLKGHWRKFLLKKLLPLQFMWNEAVRMCWKFYKSEEIIALTPLELLPFSHAATTINERIVFNDCTTWWVVKDEQDCVFFCFLFFMNEEGSR